MTQFPAGRPPDDTCLATSERYGPPGNYVAGANLAGYVKVADAMVALGVI